MRHPIRERRQRREAERRQQQAAVRRAVRNARLDTYCPQAEDRLDAYRQWQESRRWSG